jgi:hypothetical protein
LVPGYIDLHLQPKTFDWLADWHPLGSTGWTAGNASDDFGRLSDNIFVAAALRYTSGISFLTTIPVTTESGDGFCAYEHLWAAELMGQLALSGSFFSASPGAAILACGLRIDGLEGAVAFHATHGRFTAENLAKVQDSEYAASGLFSGRDLSSDPRAAAKQLLDPLFASFVSEGYDVVQRLRAGGA